jgi:hypothetical protein
VSDRFFIHGEYTPSLSKSFFKQVCGIGVGITKWQALVDPAAKIEGGPEGLFANGTVSGAASGDLDISNGS